MDRIVNNNRNTRRNLNAKLMERKPIENYNMPLKERAAPLGENVRNWHHLITVKNQTLDDDDADVDDKDAEVRTLDLLETQIQPI